MIELINGVMTARISKLGAELKSLKKGNEEYIWSGDPLVWSGTAPVLFPILGFLKNDKYILNGKEYRLEKHGFARNKVFGVENITDCSVTFLLKEDAESLKSFPFKFEFRVIYTLLKDSLKVEYTVKNFSNENMYFSVGAHEAYVTNEGIEDYDMIFPEKEDFETILLNVGLLRNGTMLIAENTNVLPLCEKYFTLDTLIFRNLKSRSCVLKNRKTERAIKVEFPNCDYLGIWHKISSKFICIEPWSGLPDNEKSNYDITHKEGIISLNPDEEYSNIHTITVL